MRGRFARLVLAVALLGVLAVLVGGSYAGLVTWRGSRPRDLPAPAGPYAVGRVEATWTDSARDDRELSVWRWYPAEQGTGMPAHYLPGAWSGLQLPFPVGLGETDLDSIGDPALEGARPAPGRFPVVVLEPGLGFAAPQYAVLAEDLASRGFVVLGVTPTGSANTTVLDGRVVHATEQGDPSDFDGDHTAHDEAIAAGLLRTWVADARFVADRAERSGAPSVAYVGHSFGGAAALEACREDRRCAAAVDVDGSVYGAVSRTGLHAPVLLLGHDDSCVTGACDPVTAADRTDVSVARRLLAASTSTTEAEDVGGTGHLDFTDYGAYYLAEPLRLLLGLGPLDGRLALRAETVTVGRFLQEALTAGAPRPRPPTAAR